MPTYTFAGVRSLEDRNINKIQVGKNSDKSPIWLNLGASADIDSEIAAQLDRRFILTPGSGQPVIPLQDNDAPPPADNSNPVELPDWVPAGDGILGELLVSQGNGQPADWLSVYEVLEHDDEGYALISQGEGMPSMWMPIPSDIPAGGNPGDVLLRGATEGDSDWSSPDGVFVVGRGESLATVKRQADWVAPAVAGGDVTNMITGVITIPASGKIFPRAGAVYVKNSIIGGSFISIVESPVANGVATNVWTVVSTTWVSTDRAANGGGILFGEPLTRNPGDKFVYKLAAGTVSGGGIVTISAFAGASCWLDISAA